LERAIAAAPVKVRIEEWVLAVDIYDIYKDRLFRPVTKGGKLAGVPHL